MAVANPSSTDEPVQSGFVKELEEKGAIIAIDGVVGKNEHWSLKNRVYHISLDGDSVIPDALQQKIGDNTETIRLQVQRNRLGAGGFGSVFRCLVKEEQGSGSSIAETDICLKLGLHWDERSRPNKEVNRHILREIQNFHILSRRPHKNIIKFLFACSTTDNQVCLGLEYFRGYDLSRTINKYRQKSHRFPTDHINIILRGVVSAVMHLQTFDMIHCDIKPHNVLFSSYTLRVKLIDFGCAFLCKEPKSDFGGTSIYMAPEMFGKDKQPHLDSTDVYSIGALGFRMVTYRRPWEDDPEVASALEEKSRHKVYIAIQKAMGKIVDEELDDGSRASFTSLQMTLRDPQADHKKMYPVHCDLICNMLDRSPAMRPNCEKILAVINDECSNLGERREQRRMAELSAELAATNFDSSDEMNELLPALPQLDASHSCSTAIRPTEAPSTFVSDDRKLHIERRLALHTHSAASHHSSSGSKSNESVLDGKERQPVVRFERQLSNQRTRTGSHLEPIVESQICNYPPEPCSDDRMVLEVVESGFRPGNAAESATRDAPETIADAVANVNVEESHEFSDSASNMWSSVGESFEAGSLLGARSSFLYYRGAYSESFSYHVNDSFPFVRYAHHRAESEVGDYSMPSLEDDVCGAAAHSHYADLNTGNDHQSAQGQNNIGEIDQNESTEMSL